MKVKQRLDKYLLEQYPALSRSYIQSMIMQGRVSVNTQAQTKVGFFVTHDDAIDVTWPIEQYVSRAGLKLDHALKHFALSVQGLLALDAGISTGGFTDCLLKHGAQRVYGFDVGYGQLHEKLRADKRVILTERTNVRYLKQLPCLENEQQVDVVDVMTLDLSFISLLKVIPTLKNLLAVQGILIVLIKPQFEALRHQVGKGGIVSSDEVHVQVVQRVTDGIIALGFSLHGVIDSPIKGTDGNKEFLALFYKN